MIATQTLTQNTPKQTILYYREGSSDKVYHVSLEPDGDRFLVRFAYGRRGATLQTGTKTSAPVAYDAALRTFDQLVASKVAKGYTPGEDGTPYQHTDHEGRATGIYPQLLTAVEDEHALGHLMLDFLYCAQEKHDGQRLLLRRCGEAVEGINRKGLIVSIPAAIVDAARRIEGDFLLDGEAVGDTLHVFDILERRGVDLRGQPYGERLKVFTELLGVESMAIQPVSTAITAKQKIALLERMRRENKEGIVLKKMTAAYTPGKASSDQLKYKLYESASFVVNLVHHSKRSVSLGLFASQFSLVGAGNVTIPANNAMPEIGSVVEVRYLYAFRQSGAVYQPRYLGVREDIDASECTTSQLKYRSEPAATIRV